APDARADGCRLAIARSLPAERAGSDRRALTRTSDGDADQAPGRDLPGEPLVRRLLRHLSRRGESAWTAALPGAARHAIDQRAHRHPAAVQPEPVESVPDRPRAGVYL